MEHIFFAPLDLSVRESGQIGVSLKNILAGHPGSSSCINAKQWLDENHIEYVDRNILEDFPTEKELKEWIQKSGKPVFKFLRKKSKQYEELCLEERKEKITQAEGIRLLIENKKLLKRPLLITEEYVFIGFKEKKWEERLCCKQPMENDLQSDWEYSAQSFTSGAPIGTIEEYAEECAQEEKENRKVTEAVADSELARIIEDVKAVKKESEAGGTVKEIALKLNLSEQYITTILFTVQGYPEDNEVAVARLVQLG